MNTAEATEAVSSEITRELARGKFTDEMLAEMRALIGTELRTDACVNNEYATRLAILRFCGGNRRRQPALDRSGLCGDDRRTER